MMDAETLTRRLGGAWNGTTGTCRCPAHDDQSPSLSVTDKPGGGVLVHCFAECSQEKLIGRLRDMRLWDGPSDDEDAIEEDNDQPNGEPTPVRAYNYRDEHGKPRYRVVRWSDKSFTQEVAVGKSYHSGKGCMTGVVRLPYMLPELLEAPKDEPVFLPEGEKDEVSLDELRVVASCNAGRRR